MTTTEENAKVRGAYLEIIYNALQKAKLQRVEFEPKAYDREGDRVHFTYDGERVTLLEVSTPFYDSGELPMVVERKRDKVEVGLIAPVMFLQIKTLQRIAYEVYDWVRGEDWEDWDFVEKDMIANFLDSAW